ncbi:SDR family oxidoreductase [Asaia sp. HN010]|uniref:SDR family oxidoreductase n=1 Tax=Asaia sp. HN010 TaxID=3081233 RepID=UPI003016FDF8
MTIAITGASGQLGQLVLNRLSEEENAEPIIALMRTPTTRTLNTIETRRFDYSQIETLIPGLTGVDTLVLISSSEISQRVTQHRNVIAAAQSANVKRIIYTSVLHADISGLSLADEHRATEAVLRESGLSFTILRNGWYSENYTASVKPALDGGAFIGSAGKGLISSASRADYADALAITATDSGHSDRIYELAGDTAWTLAELAAEISLQSGKKIPYLDLPADEYAQALIKFGLPDGLASAIASWDSAASRGALFDDGHQLSALIGRSTTSLAASVASALE